MQDSDVPFYDEEIIDNFEVEELEHRLENKWGKPICLSIDGCDPSPKNP